MSRQERDIFVSFKDQDILIPINHIYQLHEPIRFLQLQRQESLNSC